MYRAKFAPNVNSDVLNKLALRRLTIEADGARAWKLDNIFADGFIKATPTQAALSEILLSAGKLKEQQRIGQDVIYEPAFTDAEYDAAKQKSIGGNDGK
jgi:hypothetical protein